MSDLAHDTGEHGKRADEIGFSPVVASIFETLLSAIHSGRMAPGDKISDAKLADEFAVSRTPVREAILQLRELGVVEVAAGRFTRVAAVSPRQTKQAMLVWAALYGALVDEVAAAAPPDVREAMARDQAAFAREIPGSDYRALATYTFSFYSHLLELSANPILIRSITRVVHVIRLGGLHLPESIDIPALSEAQAQLVSAIDSRDPVLAHAAIDMIRHIDVPQD